MKKVLFLLNNAPNYRDKFLKELSKKVELTVISRSGKNINLKEPEVREGYKYIELQEHSIMGINFNIKQFTHATYNNFDVIIMGASLKEPFLLLNLFRRRPKKILFGHIFNLSITRESWIKKLFYKFTWSLNDSFLVHTDYIKHRLQNRTTKPIYSFNNTYFYSNEIEELPFQTTSEGLNILWVGRYIEEPHRLRNINCLINIAERHSSKINLCLIGPGMKEAFYNKNVPSNVQIKGQVYDEDILRDYYSWSHVVMNPGIVGLLVMNTARFGRPIILDLNSVQGPEVQLAIDADQPFIDFDNENEVNELINKFLEPNSHTLNKLGSRMAQTMKKTYTLEYMVDKFIEAINN